MIVYIIGNNRMSDSDSNNNSSSSEEEPYQNEDNTSTIKRKRDISGVIEIQPEPTSCGRDRQSKKKRVLAVASVTPAEKRRQSGGTNNKKGSRALGLSVSSVSSMSQAVLPVISEHFSESSAVREFVRGHIYPKKKTIFCEDELVFGSPLAKSVSEYMLYAKDGFYRRKRETVYEARQAVEVCFWTRNQETVRRVLREKLNNSVSRYRYRMKSK